MLFGVTVAASAMIHISGDPVALILESGIATNDQREELRIQLGLDRPFAVQYRDFVIRAIKGDLGRSLRFRQPALEIVLERLPATVHLAIGAMLFSVLIAVPVGIITAIRPHGLISLAGRLLTLVGQSVPLFWLGIMFVLIFSVWLRWLPVAGRFEHASIVLPATTLGLYPMARIARILRVSMLESLSMEYCRTARSKGLSEVSVILRHVLRNAAVPVVTVMGLQFGYLLGGAVVTETIFAWPGVGWLSVQAVTARDMPLVQAIIVVVALMYTFINLLTDVFCAYLNPQIIYD